MTALPPLAALVSFCALTGCGAADPKQADSAGANTAEPAMASAVTATPTIAALGLSEMQLLDADLVAADGTDLGDVEQVRRTADGKVDAVVVEVDESSPERYVLVPITGLTTRANGDDVDLQTTMTRADIAKLPDATMVNR